MRLDPGVNRLESRLLPEPLAVFPLLAATSTTDAEWSAIVAWSIDSLLRAEAPEAAWAAGGLASLPIAAPRLGLDQAWQKRVVAAAGTYGDIYARNLGALSPFGLARGPNAPWQEGGLFVAPYAD
jgi:general L-amino acid transport system substrate-binding protein